MWLIWEKMTPLVAVSFLKIVLMEEKENNAGMVGEYNEQTFHSISFQFDFSRFVK